MFQILRSPPIFSTIDPPSRSLFSCQCFSRTHRPIDGSICEVRRQGLAVPSQVVSGNRRGLSGAVCRKMDDAFYMRRCVELAKKAIGCTSPNPMVGCVIVKDGEIVGQGFHPKAGQPHAEVFALRDAGKLAENATAYVSLEPCNHYGRTPPCTEALINAKIKQVIVGMVDPNPLVASKGLEKLRASGIDVIVGVEEMLCQKLNEAYIHRMHTGKPFVTLRYSLSLNGRLLNHLGKDAEAPGGYYSKLVQECDAIVVSGNLMNGTSSSPPTSLEPGAKQPLQIIIARNMTSLHLPIAISSSSSRIVVMAESSIHVEPKSERVETVFLERANLNSVLDYCGSRGLCSIVLDIRDEHGSVAELLEEGSLEEGSVQKVVMELCPVWSGSSEASLPPFFGMEQRKLKDLQLNATNETVLVEGYF